MDAQAAPSQLYRPDCAGMKRNPYEMKGSAHGKTLKVGQRLTTERVGFAIQKGNASLTGAVNAQMKKMTEDGTYLKLSQKYFGRDVRCK